LLREVNILALIKGNERYVYVYDDASRANLIAFLREQAADPDLALTGFDAAVLIDRARQQALANASRPSRSRI
jgi:hypothetical protein